MEFGNSRTGFDVEFDKKMAGTGNTPGRFRANPANLND